MKSVIIRTDQFPITFKPCLVGKLIITDSLHCPWGKKALKLSLNSTSSTRKQKIEAYWNGVKKSLFVNL